MRIAIISLFPEMFGVLNYGVTGKAIKKGFIDLSFWNPRDYMTETSSGYKHRRVDDRPYGGGPGMVMRVQPLCDAVRAARQELGKQTDVIHLSPQGKRLTQEMIMGYAKQESFIMVASRYEGVDERFIEMEVDEEWSIGDYILTGGELPVMVVIDAIARLIPGVVGNPDSVNQDSFINGLLECPHYTRPEEFKEKWVPPILLTGNHQMIANWRLKQSLGRTWLKRPDLLEKWVFTPFQKQLLSEFIREYQEARGKTHE
jgi:tRNA (guanine37-N1)-methyltransferase